LLEAVEEDVDGDLASSAVVTLGTMALRGSRVSIALFVAVNTAVSEQRRNRKGRVTHVHKKHDLYRITGRAYVMLMSLNDISVRFCLTFLSLI